MPTLTLKTSKQLKAQIAATAKQRGVTQSELVRLALEWFLREQPKSHAYDLIRDLIENLPDAPELPRDLSSNAEYMSGFGLSGPESRELLARQRKRRARRTR